MPKFNFPLLVDEINVQFKFYFLKFTLFSPRRGEKKPFACILLRVRIQCRKCAFRGAKKVYCAMFSGVNYIICTDNLKNAL